MFSITILSCTYFARSLSQRQLTLTPATEFGRRTQETGGRGYFASFPRAYLHCCNVWTAERHFCTWCHVWVTYRYTCLAVNIMWHLWRHRKYILATNNTQPILSCAVLTLNALYSTLNEASFADDYKTMIFVYHLVLSNIQEGRH